MSKVWEKKSYYQGGWLYSSRVMQGWEMTNFSPLPAYIMELKIYNMKVPLLIYTILYNCTYHFSANTRKREQISGLRDTRTMNARRSRVVLLDIWLYFLNPNTIHVQLFYPLLYSWHYQKRKKLELRGAETIKCLLYGD